MYAEPFFCKHPPVHIDTESQRPIAKPVSKSCDISIAGKQRLAVISPLNYVNRKVHRTQSASPRQAPYPFYQMTEFTLAGVPTQNISCFPKNLSADSGT